MTEHFRGRTDKEVAEAMAQLRPLADAGYTLFPLAPRSKVPAEAGWRGADYSQFDVEAWLRRDGNVGVRLGNEEIVIDIDPRNGGDEAWKTLSWYFGEDHPTVRTGSGGQHIYLRKPADVTVRGKMLGYPGIDVKTFGGFVVAPGSIHPDTGQPYLIESGSFAAVQPLPHSVLDQLRRPEAKERSAASGAITPEQLAALLGSLDASDFGHGGPHHDEWEAMMFACHDGTNAAGQDEWLAWCATDKQYGAEVEALNRNRWQSCTAGATGGVTVATLYKAVVRAGHPELVAAIGGRDDTSFDDDLDPELIAQPDEAERKRGARFRRWSIGDLVALPPPAWLVENIVPEGALVQVYGRRKSNKTFATLDLALCVATGRPFHDTKVTRGRVTYVIGEGGGARFGDRIMAWCKHNKVAASDLDNWFAVVPQRVSVDNKQDLRDFFAGDEGACDLTIFDTVARSMDGDENSTADMNRFVKGLDQVREHYHGTTLVVHHSGKDEGKQGRGSTALPGAVDATIKVSRNAAGQTVMEVEEIRDAAPGTKFTFDPVNVTIGDDLRTSLVLRLVASQTEIVRPRNAKEHVLVRIAEAGALRRAELVDPTTPSMSKANVNKAIKALLEEELLVEDGGGVRVTQDGENAALALGAVMPQ